MLAIMLVNNKSMSELFFQSRLHDYTNTRASAIKYTHHQCYVKNDLGSQLQFYEKLNEGDR